MVNKLMLCADDFAYSEGVSQAILNLCKQQKINATSVMVESPYLKQYAPQLDQYRQYVQIGLHFNLTEAFQRDRFSMGSLLSPVLSLSRKQEIAERLSQQLDCFETQFSRSPDFVDGHQHIHVFPAVRAIFLETLQQYYGNAINKPWIRQVSPIGDTNTPFKTMILKLLNLGFRKQCSQRKFKNNRYFSGVYSLRAVSNYEVMLDNWLNASPEDTLVMCHPSTNLLEKDPIGQARLQEYKRLLSIKPNID